MSLVLLVLLDLPVYLDPPMETSQLYCKHLNLEALLDHQGHQDRLDVKDHLDCPALQEYLASPKPATTNRTWWPISKVWGMWQEGQGHLDPLVLRDLQATQAALFHMSKTTTEIDSGLS